MFFGQVNNAEKGVLGVSGFVEGKLPLKYWGVLLPSSRLTRRDFKLLIDKISSKISSWTVKFLSQRCETSINYFLFS